MMYHRGLVRIQWKFGMLDDFEKTPRLKFSPNPMKFEALDAKWKSLDVWQKFHMQLKESKVSFETKNH